MKKKILTLALTLLLLPILAHAQAIDWTKPFDLARSNYTLGTAAPPAASKFCDGTTCSNSTGANVLCEDCEQSASCNCTWDLVYGGYMAVNTSPSAGSGEGAWKCTETQTRNWKIDKNGGGGSCYNFGFTASSTVYVIGYVYLISLDDSSSTYIFHLNQGGANNELCGLAFFRSGSTYTLNGVYKKGSDSSYAGGTAATVSLNHWYPFKIEYETNALCRVSVDLNNDGDFADANEVLLNTTDAYFLNAGGLMTTPCSYSSTNWSWEFDQVKISTTGVPSLCAR